MLPGNPRYRSDSYIFKDFPGCLTRIAESPFAQNAEARASARAIPNVECIALPNGRASALLASVEHLLNRSHFNSQNGTEDSPVTFQVPERYFSFQNTAAGSPVTF